MYPLTCKFVKDDERNLEHADDRLEKVLEIENSKSSLWILPQKRFINLEKEKLENNAGKSRITFANSRLPITKQIDFLKVKWITCSLVHHKNFLLNNALSSLAATARLKSSLAVLWGICKLAKVRTNRWPSISRSQRKDDDGYDNRRKSMEIRDMQTVLPIVTNILNVLKRSSEATRTRTRWRISKRWDYWNELFHRFSCYIRIMG